jgi:hypothetical protein
MSWPAGWSSPTQLPSIDGATSEMRFLRPLTFPRKRGPAFSQLKLLFVVAPVADIHIVAEGGPSTQLEIHLSMPPLNTNDHRVVLGQRGSGVVPDAPPTTAAIAAGGNAMR